MQDINQLPDFLAEFIAQNNTPEAKAQWERDEREMGEKRLLQTARRSCLYLNPVKSLQCVIKSIHQ
jgi:hypothetical protein